MSPDLRSHAGPRSAAKRERIVAAAMRAFAERGYQGARVEDIASELGIAKGSIFQHFGSKAGLFFAAYQRAVQSLPAWLDAPAEVVDEGFWAVLVYWLERTEHLIRDDWIPYRVALVGNYGTDLELRHEINRYLVSEDPYGTLEFIEHGVRRGDLRADLDVEMAASMLDWLASEFVSGGWRIKRMHRMIVLSNTYQMASTADATALAADPDGALMWRFRPQRMEAEALRDTILAVSGELNLAQRGPGIYPTISRAVLETQSRPGDGWRASEPADA